MDTWSERDAGLGYIEETFFFVRFLIFFFFFFFLCLDSMSVSLGLCLTSIIFV